ncbi:MAG: hypothetical protein ABFD54_13790 [Armatimonadota bacterium]|nr:hypothetical protein [bacterium]
MTNRLLIVTVLANLRELADENYQRRVWTSSSGPEMSSFDEDVCGLFDDSGLGDELDKPGPVFSEVIDRHLRVLDARLQSIDARCHPLEVIQDPRMEEVRAQAKHLLDLFAFEGYDVGAS